MRFEYTVSSSRVGWTVRRGHTSPLSFPDQDTALRAAEGLARAAVANGDTAVVKLVVDGAVAETRGFKPEATQRTEPSVPRTPEPGLTLRPL